MGTETNKDDRNNPEYLAQLLKDKKQIQAFPNVFVHLEKLLDEGKFWLDNFQVFFNADDNVLIQICKIINCLRIQSGLSCYHGV